MKRVLALSLALLLAFTGMLTLASCQKPEEETLILGFDATYPPFGYQAEDGSYTGFDIEYAQKVCDKLGMKLELKPIDWEAKDEMIKTGAIDCIWNGFTYEGREDDYAWTDRYLNNSIVVLVKSDSGIATLADLAGKAVSVQSDSSGESALKKKTDLVASLKDGKYLTEPDYTTAFTKLEAGSFDAIVIDVGVANYLTEGKSGYTILSEEISKETYGVGFAKENTALRDKIDTAIKEVAADTAFVKALCEKYGVQYSAFLLGK